MVQKEVGERICAKNGKERSAVLTLAVEYYGEAEYLFTIDRKNSSLFLMLIQLLFYKVVQRC